MSHFWNKVTKWYNFPCNTTELIFNATMLLYSWCSDVWGHNFYFTAWEEYWRQTGLNCCLKINLDSVDLPIAYQTIMVCVSECVNRAWIKLIVLGNESSLCQAIYYRTWIKTKSLINKKHIPAILFLLFCYVMKNSVMCFMNLIFILCKWVYFQFLALLYVFNSEPINLNICTNYSQMSSDQYHPGNIPSLVEHCKQYIKFLNILFLLWTY